jgi:DNA-binding response OmpR family regulator
LAKKENIPIMPKLLIVEDQKAILEELVEVLEKQGYAVFKALTGKEAIALIHQQNPQIIILDLYLDDMSGLNVLKEAKAVNPKTCVIVLTGFDVETTKEKAFALGADYFLIKPIPWTVLKEYLAEIAKGITEKNNGQP